MNCLQFSCSLVVFFVAVVAVVIVRLGIERLARKLVNVMQANHKMNKHSQNVRVQIIDSEWNYI